MSRLGLAISLAAKWHYNQKDKSGEPYILHPLRVMNAVRAAGFGEEYQITAVLHDVLEDTHEADLLEIQDAFGQDVAQAVDALSRRFDPHKAPNARDASGARAWGEPRETHWEYFLRAVENPIARVVKYFDTLDNADPKRYCPGVPVGRYIKVMEWYSINGLSKP